MKITFSDLISTHYGQAYVHLEDTLDWAEDVWANQTNGLLGAAQPTTLFLTIGLHTGQVHLTVRVADTAPTLDDSWEEIVEASFTMPASQTLGLADWHGSIWEPIPLEAGTHRVRYCARNFGEGEECSHGDSTTHPTEEYELTFWPAPHKADQIVKATRPRAQYWHKAAQGKA